SSWCAPNAVHLSASYHLFQIECKRPRWIANLARAVTQGYAIILSPQFTPGESAMDFELSAEQKLLKQTAQAFADKQILPGARERDRKAEFPTEVIAKLGALGFLGPLVPEKYGGMGADFLSEAIIFEEVGRADSSVRTTLSVQISLCEAPIM